MSEPTRHPVDLLAEEFAARLRAGEAVQIDEYLAKAPEYAQLIRTIFPSIEIVERVSQHAAQTSTVTAHSTVTVLQTRPPESLGDFQIVREIGRGGMGVVYEAVQKSLKRSVALKVVSALVATSDVQRERFRREAESAAGLHHTNIVPVFGIGEDNGLQYYAMQLIDGVPFSDVIAQLRSNSSGVQNAKTEQFPSTDTLPSNSTQSLAGSCGTFNAVEAANLLLTRSTITSRPGDSEGGLPKSAIAETVSASAFFDLSNSQTAGNKTKSFGPAVTVPFAGQTNANQQPALGLLYYRKIVSLIADVANALAHAHHQGVLHRDIKPGNLLLDRDGTVWVSDFGLARKAEMDGVTQTGEIVGTLRYMAPEQLLGQFHARSDIYSLGVTLYELLTLRPAIETPQKRLTSNGKSDQIVRPRLIRSDIPWDLETIVLKASSWEAEHRYSTATELEQDLRCFLEDRPISARPILFPERFWRWSRRNPAIATLSAATITLLLAIVLMLGFGFRQKQLAFNEIDKLYAQTQGSLREKSAALDAVELERSRAETNLDLAVEAFGEIIDNIVSRGSAESLLDDLEEGSELLGGADATLSSADVDLLTRTLKFFERFSEANAKDLSSELAQARLRIGDIQMQLGELDDAQQSYLSALDNFAKLATQQTGNFAPVLMQAEILNNLTVISAKRGDLMQSISRHEQALKLLEGNATLRASKDGRFALAKTYGCIASLGSRIGMDAPPRQPVRPFARFLPFPERPPLKLSPLHAMRLKRQEDSNARALVLLKDLVSEDAGHLGYRATLAKAYRDNVRIAQFSQDVQQAERSLELAVEILEKLINEQPSIASFKYQLADALCTPLYSGDENGANFSRALKLCEELIAEQPNVPEFRALRATALVRTAEHLFAPNRPGQVERAIGNMRQAIAIQLELAKQSPDVLLYHFTLLVSLQRLAEMHLARKDPSSALKTFNEAISIIENFQGADRLRAMLGAQYDRLVGRRNAIQLRQETK